MNYESLLADRTQAIGASAIREILKAASKPGMVSLAGGIPAPESFPLEVIRMLSEKVIQTYGAGAFQYDRTEGFQPLQTSLSGYLEEKGIPVRPDEILITTGSQSALDSIGKILIGRGDGVAVEAPTYLGALQAFNPYRPKYIHLDSDDDGLVPACLNQAISNHRIKFIYLIPNFQNPTGRTIPMERRREIAQIIQTNDILLIEDDPYGDLRYQGDPIPTIRSMAPGHVIYIGSLSKIFSPGLRIGFCLAPPPIRKWLVFAKQGVDLHTSTFNQALAAEYLSGGYLKKTLANMIRLYRPRCEQMLASLERYFPETFHWSRPSGGMFLWVEGPERFPMQEVYQESLKQKVAFVPGTYFHASPGQGLATMRLNFTMASEKKLDEAVRTLSEIIKERTPAVAA